MTYVQRLPYDIARLPKSKKRKSSADRADPWKILEKHLLPLSARPRGKFHRAGLVYFIRSGSDGPIKIGSSTLRSVRGRIASLQIGNPEQLQLIAILICERCMQMEQALHMHLAEHRLNGEWFRADDRVLAFATLAEAGRLDMIEELLQVR